MKRLIILGAALALPISILITPANAGELNYATGVVTQVAPPVGYTPPPPISPFDGLYIFGTASSISGGVFDYRDKEKVVDLTSDGTGYGLGIGYGQTFGSFYLGGEAEYALLHTADSAFCHNNCWKCDSDLESTINLSIRGGVVAGDALIYAHIGWTQAQVNAGVSNVSGSNREGASGSINGISYGAGIDYAVTERMFVGVKYIVSDYDDFTFNARGGNNTVDFDNQQVQLRVGWNF